MTYKTNEGKTYAIVGTVDGTVASASGVVIASFTANKQAYFTAPDGGYVTISDETAIVTPVFKLAPSALVGESGGGDTPAPSGDYSDYCGYIEYDDETGVIVDLSVPKYLGGNLSFKNAVLPENYEWKFDMPVLTIGELMFYNCTNLISFSSDLSALTNGSQMFCNCTNLTSFSSDLSALTNGYYMFSYCKLDAASVERILTTIPTYTDGSEHLLALWFSSEAASKFEEITGVTPTTYLASVSYKGWTMSVRIYNG